MQELPPKTATGWSERMALPVSSAAWENWTNWPLFRV